MLFRSDAAVAVGQQAQLDGYPRIAAAKQIASRVRHRLGITSTVGDQELLAEVLAEYHAHRRFG